MEILVLVMLTLLNGFFALSEIAIVSVRKTRIEQKAKAGNKNAQTVLNLLAEPEDFLSAVQVGITLIGIISGAYGGAALSDDVRPWLEQISYLAPYADSLSFVLVIAAITYFSIVIGELIPKTIAMGNSEEIALFVAPIIRIFTKVTLPLVKLLSVSTSLISRLLRVKAPSEEKISEEDLRQILKTAGRQGLLAKEETELHQNLFYFSRQRARSMQTHRKDLEWIDLSAPIEKIKAQVHQSIHSKFPVGDGSLDNVVGVLTTKDFYEYLLEPSLSLQSIIKKPIYVSETMLAGPILELFRKHKQNMGVVVDEYGAVEGIITLHDILEAIVGDLPDIDEGFEPDIARRADGSYLVNAGISIRMLNRGLEQEIIRKDPTNYATLAGFITCFLSRVPKTGEKLLYNGYEFEVVDMDGFKIDKVIVKRLPAGPVN
ncbi:HlyC/CorC family transporter [Adhaeribacter sp. BT258]|uniref:HlyC/CorC family transporter n=1 Tax=Adhaeribacter terrigena TaxID=2793070 RepID=A0ABS1C1Y2_9BACT|nr:hemolysin family protein [Adhaeribacter terrigena]MBK0403391.1 HlyC/CorC family transporter [Adhaeribacter terrigena]